MFAAVVLAAGLDLTLPCTERPDTIPCEMQMTVVPNALHDLDSLFVVGYARGWATVQETLARLDVHGLECQHYHVSLDTLMRPFVANVVTCDRAFPVRNCACLSNAVPLNFGDLTGVPPIGTPLERRWFDIAGRRLAEPPHRSGWYAVRWFRGHELVASRDTVVLR